MLLIFKKNKKKNLSWGLGFLRLRRSPLDSLPARPPMLKKSIEPTALSSPPSIPQEGVEIKADVSFKSPPTPLSPEYGTCSHDRDFFDGAPKMWMQSRNFFCETTVYNQPTNMQSRSSCRRWEEDTKWWHRADENDHFTQDPPGLGIIEEQRSSSVSNNSDERKIPPSSPLVLFPPRIIDTRALEEIRSASELKQVDDVSISESERSSYQPPSYIRGSLRKGPSARSPKLAYSQTSRGSSKSSCQRLVSTWSADTLSLLEKDNQENDAKDLIDSSQEAQQEEFLSLSCDKERQRQGTITSP